MKKPPETNEEMSIVEAGLIESTVASVTALNTFYEVLTQVGDEPLLAYGHNVKRDKVSKATGERMLRDRLDMIVPAMRMALYPLLIRGLDTARATVLIHMAVMVGCDRLTENSDLWKALARKDYREAHNALMQTHCPPNSEPVARRHMPRLALALFTG